jgi:hypothetical protein
MTRSILACAVTLALLSACNNQKDDEFRFRPVNTGLPTSAVAPKLLVHERYLAFLADEAAAGGQNFNSVSGDADADDHVATIVNMVSRETFNIGVAARDFAFLGGHLFLEVDEAEDSRDWSSDGMADDIVLLRVAAAAATNASVQFVALVRDTSEGVHMLVSDNDRLFFTSLNTAAPGETTLSVIKLVGGVPAAPEVIDDADGNTRDFPLLLGEDSNVVFAALDETAEGDILNGDGAADDEFVLALIDATATDPKLKNVALPMADGDSPVRALEIGGEWVVAFLVDETAHGAGSLNDSNDHPGLQPPHCSGNDTDTTDEVLHHLRFDTVAGAPTLTAVTNTGLAGVDRVLLVKNGANTFVATLVPEGDEGNCATGLNADGDTNDRVLRWLRAVPAGGAIFTDIDGFVAIANVDGGLHGVTDLAGRWIAVIDEAADGNSTWDGIPGTDNDIVAWLDPSDGLGAQWTTDHDAATNGVQAVGTTFLDEMASRQRVFMGFQESVANLAINGRDTDKLDSIPVFVRFDPNDADDLDFPGPAVATHDNRIGTVIENDVAYYRVDESDDNFDWNGDGDKLDEVLFRTTVSTLDDSFFIATLNALPIPAVVTDSNDVGAAWLVQESMLSGIGGDLNGDGDTDDFFVFYMRVGP